jgi:copper(I)-binding protein
MRQRKALAVMVVLCVGLVFPASASAAEIQLLSALKLSQVWAKRDASRGGTVYLTIQNTGKEDDQLIAASSPVARKVALFALAEKKGILGLRKVTGIKIAAQSTVTMLPRDTFLMLSGVRAGMKVGKRIPVTLTFRSAGAITVRALIVPKGAEGLPPEPEKKDDPKKPGPKKR